MTKPEADRWNEKYRREIDLWMGMEPRQLLVSFIDQVPRKGLALDAACGVGTNAAYLAKHGLRVIGIDISEYALHLAAKRLSGLDYPIDFIVADLSHPWLPREFFDVISNFHFLERASIPVFRRALKPGGLILFDTFMATDETINTPRYYLSPGELEHLFRGFEILHYSENILNPSQSHGERGSAQIVARKPGDLQDRS
jgi:SAM-dependent methyltransferase